MATPPTRVSYGASAFNTATTPKTVSVTVLPGDCLIVMALAANANSPTSTAPTGDSLTYTQVASLGTTGNHARVIAWTATATTGSTFNVSATRPSSNAAVLWGVVVWVYRGSDGFGAVGAPTVNSTSNSVTLTTTGANSALLVGSVDWNSTDGTTRTRRTVNSTTGTEESYFRDAAEYTLYVQRYDDTGATGSKTAGYSAPTGQATGTIAIEVLGAAGGAPAIPATLVMQTRRAY